MRIYPTRKNFLSYVIMVLVLLSGFLLKWSYLEGYWRFNYPDRRVYPLAGIDVSHHQGQINWNQVPKEEVVFAFIKATEGGDYRDPLFRYNWGEAAKAGFTRGAYHFFTYRKSGAEQAENFIASVPVERGTLPPVVDFEFGGDPAQWPARETVLAELFEFLRRLENAYGQRPIIYATYEAYDRYLVGAVDGYPLWIRDIFWKPTMNDKGGWNFWQYANNGRISGINMRVDLNVFAGSREELEMLRRDR